jgi:hypothetical protein
MEAELLDDPAEFLAEAEPFLLADEARHNLILGIAGNIRDGSIYDDFRLWLVRDGGEVAAVAVRTPPYNLILAQPRSSEALVALADTVTDDLPGVVGAVPEAVEFAGLWSSRTARPQRTNMRQGVYALDRVEPPPSAPGSARVATTEDREVAVRWFVAFSEEALHEGSPGADQAEAIFDHREPIRPRRSSTTGSRPRRRDSSSGTTAASPSRSPAGAGGRRTESASARSTPRPSCAAAATRLL